jgi:hypothetical protein
VEYPIVPIDREWCRLIPSKFPTMDVYERLQSNQLRAVALQLEKLTNPRLAAKARLTRNAVPAATYSPQLQNWNHAPFAYVNPDGTYLLGPPFPVMEVAGDARGALAWAILRREKFMRETDEPFTGLDMRMLTNRIRANFVDLRGASLEIDQADRWKLGRHYYDRQASGILFRHPEIPGAEFLSIFNPIVLAGEGVLSSHYRFRWNGTRISLIYDFETGLNIKRGDLFHPHKGLELSHSHRR